MSADTLPPFHIVVCKSDQREPGMMMFNVRPGGVAEHSGNVGWFLGVDQAGEIALDLTFDSPTQDSRLLPNGNILISLTAAGLIMEVQPDGSLVRQWHIDGKWVDKIPPEGSIEIDALLTHHTISTFSNGNLMLLTAEMRELDDWPQSDEDPNAPRGRSNVIGDVVLEVAPDGEIVNRIKIFDVLDPTRLCYGSCAGYWRPRGFDDSFDWCHANSAIHDTRDDSIIMSFRTQDCLIKIDRHSGELKWILGDPGNWREPWASRLLKPDASVAWQYHQHDCSITPDGNLLCFDNGNCRAVPFKTQMPDDQCYSRAVEFDIDEDAMTVHQVWAYGGPDQDMTYACYQGGAYRLPQTGNTFITYGGVCTIDGKPTSSNLESFVRGRLVEVTPVGEVVFDMWIDSDEAAGGSPLSVFRSEFVPAG